MRICLAYDCLYPWTVGGAERWYRNLAQRLAADGHEVTYLTRLQWDPADPPQIEGVRVLAVSRADKLYGADGGRRAGPPLRFGWGMLRHLLRHGRDYDVVHTCSFPYFSVLAAALARPLGRYRLVVDWFEVWSAAYWRDYLGLVGGRIGHAVQRRCVRVRQHAFCFSRLHEERLLAEGLRGAHEMLAGLATVAEHPEPEAAQPLVLVAGRQIPEKRVPDAVAAIARVRERGLDVRGLILGDGPEHGRVLASIADHGLDGIIEAPGFVDAARVEEAMRSALCLLHPSSREGYGLVVVESASWGTPVILAAGADNAAVELLQPGINGYVAASSDPHDLAAAIVAVHDAGPELRRRTWSWAQENADRLSARQSLERVAASYASKPSARR
ncbi:unannotated protein [freshwater metagenome]|uniref:Unannotated protein n=1 Tax=freshwater metagenome TaxID=449393 RepID=A0A6J7D589_9ZZZZ|nr:glycosyltransferase [Actinomycetota bacterium]